MKLDRLVDEGGAIKREDFIEFAKKSSAVKELGLRSSRSSTPVEKAVIDKAEVVFKVNLFFQGRQIFNVLLKSPSTKITRGP